jgi:hypothetical protein
MRTGRIGRTIGRAAVVALLGVGVSVAGGHAAYADFSWDGVPAGGGQTGSSSVTVDHPTDSVSTANDFSWD